ncbi:MAG: FAD:protein FMN transferase [Clostridia bacterium]|nr:FAD:protein FMN transferase [Clostridia bacterium]
MKTKKLLLCFLTAVLCSCGQGQQVHDDMFAMDTFMSISLSGTNEDAKAVRKEIYRADNLFKKDSLDLNNEETASLATFACEISKAVSGAFDITVSPVCDLWGFWNNSFRVPEQNEIEEKLKYVDYTRINTDGGHISLPEGFSVDFGGIAKGYTGDNIKKLLKERNVTSAIISLGGNIQTVGVKPDGSPWNIGVKDPSGRSDYVGYISANDCAVVTSGGYERRFEEEGITYEHIIDPKTGYPAKTDLASVTVVSECGAAADALSTAFYVLGSQGTKSLCEETGFKIAGHSFSVLLIKRSGETETLGDIEFKSR